MNMKINTVDNKKAFFLGGGFNLSIILQVSYAAQSHLRYTLFFFCFVFLKKMAALILWCEFVQISSMFIQRICYIFKLEYYSHKD